MRKKKNWFGFLRGNVGKTEKRERAGKVAVFVVAVLKRLFLYLLFLLSSLLCLGNGSTVPNFIFIYCVTIDWTFNFRFNTFFVSLISNLRSLLTLLSTNLLVYFSKEQRILTN